MTLADAKDGEKLRVVDTIGEEVTLQAMRFGIGGGTEIIVRKNIKGGPVVVAKNHLEIAIGREIAQNIKVESVLEV